MESSSRQSMNLGKRQWGAGFDPSLPLRIFPSERRKFYGACMPCTSRVFQQRLE